LYKVDYTPSVIGYSMVTKLRATSNWAGH